MLDNYNDYILPTYAHQEIAFEKGDNATVYDKNGNNYIDFTSGIGVASVGHGNKALSEAICTQASKLLHMSNLYYTEPQQRCAESIVRLSGFDMKCFFANSGAEANEGAIKIARKFGEVDGEVKRYKIVTLKHSFHGRTITALKATGQESMHNYFGPYPDGFVYADTIEQIETLIDSHTVAVMIELVQGEGGVEPLEREKVHSLASMLKEKEILLIVDEVQTGIYRTGEFLASNLYGITPDVITLAKGLGGGVPIGVVMSAKKDIFSPGDHGSTFGGNYLSTAAANTVLALLEKEKTSGQLDRTIHYFQEKRDAFFDKHQQHFSKCVGSGLMLGIRCKSDELLAALIKSAAICGVLVLKAGRSTLRFLPPLSITTQEIDEGFERLDKAVTAL